MPNQELLNYINQQLQSGVSPEQIKSALVSSGWKEGDINEAFAELSNPVVSQSQTAQTNITVLPGAMDILQQSWLLYKQRMQTFLGIAAAPLVVSIGLLLLLAGGSLALLAKSGSSSVVAMFATGIALPLIILMVIIIAIISVWSQIALLYAIKDNQEGIGVVEAYRRSWAKILPYSWVIFLQGLITVLGFLLFIIPGIIFSVWYSLTIFVFIIEDLKGMNALQKSKEYIKGKWWAVFGRLFFIFFLFFIPVMITPILFENIPAAEVITNFMLDLFFIPLITIYLFCIYNNIKAIKN